MAKLKVLVSVLVLIFTSNVNSQWVTELTNPPGHLLEYVNIVDSTRAWAIGNHGFNQDSSILLRRASESNWIQHYLQIANNNNFTSISAMDSDKVWIGTADGKVYYHSYNNNHTELQIDVGGLGYINDIKFSRINKNYGYVYSDPPNGPGTPFKIYKTSNGGANWVELSPLFGSDYIGAHASMYVTDSDHVWLGLNCQPLFCYVPKVAYTTNGGVSWQESSIPNGSNFVSAVAFKNDNMFGIVAPWDQIPTYLFRTTNGGALWSFLNNTQIDESINSLCWAEGTSTWYFCSNDNFNQIKKSTNDGVSWTPMSANIGNDRVKYMDIIRQGNYIFGLAVTLNGKILRLIDSVSVIGIQPISTEIPERFELSQNYPNPFNPATKINFRLPEAGNVKLAVFDLLGREVTVLVNEKLAAGSYTADWDAGDYPSGIYFYRITSGSFSEIRKMILIK